MGFRPVGVRDRARRGRHARGRRSGLSAAARADPPRGRGHRGPRRRDSVAASTVGKDVSFADLRRDYAAVIVAVGAKRSRGLGLPGENGPRVYGGVDMLRAVSVGEPIDLGPRRVVIGGGNVAYDVARTVVRQAALRHRAHGGAPAGHAPRPPGVTRDPRGDARRHGRDRRRRRGRHRAPERLGAGRDPARRSTARSPACVFRRCLRVYDDARRFSPVFDDDRAADALPCDTVLIAAGQATGPVVPRGRRRPTSRRCVRAGRRWIPDTLATTAPGVFVAGDLAHGTRLLIDAVASGKKAARSVYRHVTGPCHPRRSASRRTSRSTATAASPATKRSAASSCGPVRPPSGWRIPRPWSRSASTRRARAARRRAVSTAG